MLRSSKLLPASKISSATKKVIINLVESEMAAKAERQAARNAYVASQGRGTCSSRPQTNKSKK